MYYTDDTQITDFALRAIAAGAADKRLADFLLRERERMQKERQEALSIDMDFLNQMAGKP